MYTVTYPEFFWAEWYVHQTHKSMTMVGGEWEHFQDLCL